MKINDFLILEKLSKINDPCLQRVTEWERYLDLKEFVRIPKPETSMGIQKIHNLSIPH